MPNEDEYYGSDVVEQPSNYKQFLLERLELISDLSVSLRKNFTLNKANREDHHSLVSLAIEMWAQLFPKVRGTDLEEEFLKYLPFYNNPRLFFLKGMEKYLWHLVFLIRLAFEEQGLCRVR
jgi:hypothetical protein